MNHRKWIRFLLASNVMALTVLPQSARACAACFGKSDSKLAQGMNMGIFSLLAVAVFVLGAVAAFFIFLARRASAAAQIKARLSEKIH